MDRQTRSLWDVDASVDVVGYWNAVDVCRTLEILELH